MNKTAKLIKDYAYAVVKFGLTLKKGEVVFVTAHPSSVEFVRILVRALYKMGAKRVEVDYIDDIINAYKLELGDEEELKRFYKYETEKLDFMSENKSPRIYVMTESFYEDENIDPSKVDRIIKYRQKIRELHRETLDALCPWTVLAVPSKAWARKLYPDLKIYNALEKSWKLFLKMNRVELNKTMENLKAHDDFLKEKCKYLNSLNIKELHYKSKNGTNLIVGLIDDYIYIGGSHRIKNSTRSFYPNFPTEEVFTTPNKLKVNGVVYSSKPLIYNGKEILDIKLTLKDGRIIDYSASKNYNLLKSLIETDEGSHYLGEAALVPYTSLINMSNKIFYSTLFDENAVCHFAIGQGFPFCSKKAFKNKVKDLTKLGINCSNIHIDFMIGTKDLNVDAITKSGKKVKIFRNGVWAK